MPPTITRAAPETPTADQRKQVAGGFTGRVVGVVAHSGTVRLRNFRYTAEPIAGETATTGSVGTAPPDEPQDTPAAQPVPS